MSKSKLRPTSGTTASPSRQASGSPRKSIARSIAQGPNRSPAPDKKPKRRTPEIRIGTSGWHYVSWSGPFYPAGLANKDLLAFYAQHFDTTEINNSFYRLPSEKAVREWREGTPEGFLFAWKASRFITHMKRLKDVEESLDLVFGRMRGLDDKSGPALFQLPPSLKADEETRERLTRCLAHIPRGKRCAFEFRHPSWYDDSVFDLLRDHNAALCISDHADAPAPWLVTAEFAYVRAHGTSGRYEGSYDRKNLRSWVADLETWRGEKRDVFVYFDNDIKSAAPNDAQELLGLLKKR